MNHRTESTPETVPFADVRVLLDAVEAVLDLPKDDAPDALIYRYAYASGALSGVEDGRGVVHAAAALRKLVDSAQADAEAVPGE